MGLCEHCRRCPNILLLIYLNVLKFHVFMLSLESINLFSLGPGIPQTTLHRLKDMNSKYSSTGRLKTISALIDQQQIKSLRLSY